MDHSSSFKAGRAVDTTDWHPVIIEPGHFGDVGELVLWLSQQQQEPRFKICLAWVVATEEKPRISSSFNVIFQSFNCEYAWGHCSHTAMVDCC